MIDDDEEQAPDDADPLLASETPTVDASSVRTVRKRVREAERQEREKQAFWKAVFANPVGRREMWAILNESHAFEERFACGPNGFPQVEATWFHAGEQSLGQRLYQSWVILDRAGVFLMQDEHDPRFPKPKRKRDN